MARSRVRGTHAPAVGPSAGLFAVLLALLLSGCAAARSLVAGPGDYAAYRATRVARTMDERLAASVRYLERYPDGMFASEVSAFFARNEPVFYEAHDDSAAGLSAYLHALPRGPHADTATDQLRRLLAKSAEPDALTRAATAATARLDREVAVRVAVREEVALWIGRFLDAEVWRRPLSEAPRELIIEWALGLPAPSCTAPDPAPDPAAPSSSAERKHCSKRIELPFVVVTDGRPAPRHLAMEIALVQDTAGRVHEVAFAGPDLFLRIEETHAVRPIAPDDAPSRIKAISRATELVRRQFGKKVSGEASCERRAVAPVVLDLACGGLRVTVSAGRASDEDRVVLTRFDG